MFSRFLIVLTLAGIVPQGGTLPADERALVAAMGIDLPLKALVWQDEQGMTRLTYNDPTWPAERHGIHGTMDPATDRILGSMTEALRQVADEATTRTPGEAS